MNPTMSPIRTSAAYPASMPARYLPEDDPYPLIRSALAPEFATLPAEDVESILESNGIEAVAMEGFFDDVGHTFSSAAKAVAPVAAKALPGVISGAAAGCALGPWGCLGGALIGGVGSALASGGSKPGAPAAPSSPASTIASAIPAVLGAVGGGGGAASGIAAALPAVAGLLGGAGSAGGAAGDKTNPAAVLLGLLQNPSVQQALMSMSLGGAGRKDVSVGGTAVPASAFANLVSTVGSKAFTKAEAAAEPSEDLPEYLYSNGNLAADPAIPAERAARLLEMLGEAAIPPARIARPSFSEADEYYDSLDLAELDFLETEGYDFEFDE
jgi:hypothetical protein